MDGAGGVGEGKGRGGGWGRDGEEEGEEGSTRLHCRKRTTPDHTTHPQIFPTTIPTVIRSPPCSPPGALSHAFPLSKRATVTAFLCTAFRTVYFGGSGGWLLRWVGAWTWLDLGGGLGLGGGWGVWEIKSWALGIFGSGGWIAGAVSRHGSVGCVHVCVCICFDRRYDFWVPTRI